MVSDDKPKELEESDESHLDRIEPPQPLTQPAAQNSSWGGLPIAACCIAAGGVMMSLLEVQVNSGHGATRSERLKWQERQALIDQAVSDQAVIDQVAKNDSRPDIVAGADANADGATDR